MRASLKDPFFLFSLLHIGVSLKGSQDLGRTSPSLSLPKFPPRSHLWNNLKSFLQKATNFLNKKNRENGMYDRKKGNIWISRS